MSANGQPKSPTSPPSSAVASRLSLDSDRSSAPSPLNGVNGTHVNGDDEPTDPIEKLQRELERTREEKETLATQYRNLLAKLTTMRTSLGNKLKQDAEELDRREALVQQLQQQNDELTSTVEVLKEELISASSEAERATSELSKLRSRAFEENSQETMLRERELRETQTELERCRMEKEEWERAAAQDKVMADEARSTADMYRRDLELEREAREREAAELEAERERCNNLQSVLQDFQAAKDHELRQAVKDYNSQLMQATQSLAEFKHRALTAELELEETKTNTSRTQELEREVKEKTVIVEKLRHEAIILNEHLMEALRRLRRNTTDTNVDRRLVTNVLLSFLTTPRADPKRFEMLTLLASILSWSDIEREKAGLQRATSLAPPSSSFWGRSSTSSAPKSTELEKTDETESFSRLWVEFLLTEASAGQSDPPTQSQSNPGTPVRANNSLPNSPTSPNMKGQGTRRLASFGQQAALNNMSSPTLLSPPLPRKGKEKEVDGSAS
ncbi:Guanylate kinase [Mycena indigotica]|uniref:Guanylate kinase n=1 Tax=Mycena indigotica TaxID=2126181 RepID=A0A8H6WF49_9AGAR|nr:Guanylate kinase [Mycena indigotica]KAF7316394.1 Guanylate kinase [Mycena indigotica]